MVIFYLPFDLYLLSEIMEEEWYWMKLVAAIRLEIFTEWNILLQSGLTLWLNETCCCCQAWDLYWMKLVAAVRLEIFTEWKLLLLLGLRFLVEWVCLRRILKELTHLYPFCGCKGKRNGQCMVWWSDSKQKQNGQKNSVYLWFALSMVWIWINAKLFLTSLPGS